MLGDLSSLDLTHGELERAYEAASRKVQQTLAPDALVNFAYIELLPDPTVVFRGWSHDAERTCQLNVKAPPEKATQVDLYAVRRKTPDETLEVPLWRRDENWAALVGLSWTRERPVRGTFEGDVHLQERWGSHPNGASLWQMEYVTNHADGTESKVAYGLQDGALVRL